MSKIDKYIQGFSSQEFDIKRVDKKSALFSKRNLQFRGRITWRGNFEISEVNDHKDYEKTIRQLNLFVRLKKLDYIDDSTFVQAIDGINNELYSKITNLQLEAREEVNITTKNQISINKFKYLLVIIPKSSRIEFIADLQSIISDMKKDKCSNTYIRVIVILNIISVAYHAIFFKLKDHFYPSKQQSKND